MKIFSSCPVSFTVSSAGIHCCAWKTSQSYFSLYASSFCEVQIHLSKIRLFIALFSLLQSDKSEEAFMEIIHFLQTSCSLNAKGFLE